MSLAAYWGTPSPEVLSALRLVRREEDLLDCLQALANHFPQNEKIGDALLDCILVLDDHLNN
jgi:hypothetical protein